MQFYIDISEATGCFVTNVKAICNRLKYDAKYNNKKYYHVNTNEMTLIGIDKMTQCFKIVKQDISHGDLKKMFESK